MIDFLKTLGASAVALIPGVAENIARTASRGMMIGVDEGNCWDLFKEARAIQIFRNAFYTGVALVAIAAATKNVLSDTPREIMWDLGAGLATFSAMKVYHWVNLLRRGPIHSDSSSRPIYVAASQNNIYLVSSLDTLEDSQQRS